MVTNPQGTPWAKYKLHKANRRSCVFSARVVFTSDKSKERGARFYVDWMTVIQSGFMTVLNRELDESCVEQFAAVLLTGLAWPTVWLSDDLGKGYRQLDPHVPKA